MKYPQVKFFFYVSRRNIYVHTGLVKVILSLSCCEQSVTDIAQIWEEKSQDDHFRFLKPYLINTIKGKFDYIMFEKRISFYF